MDTGSERPAAHTQQKSTSPPPPARFNSSNKYASCQLDLLSMIIPVKYLWKGRTIFILIPPPIPYGWVSTADEPLRNPFSKRGGKKGFFKRLWQKSEVAGIYSSGGGWGGGWGRGEGGIKLTFTIWGTIKLSEWVILYIGKRNNRWTNHTISLGQ